MQTSQPPLVSHLHEETSARSQRRWPRRYDPLLVVLAVALFFLWPRLWPNILASDNFMPHGMCYLWIPQLVWLHLISDSLIGLSYITISTTLAYLVYRARRDIPFHWIFLAFGLFIVACGATHLMEVWTIWQPHFWLSGYVKLVTAIASVATAVVLPPLIPKVLELVRSAKLSDERKAELEGANQELKTLREHESQRADEKLLESETRLSGIVASAMDAIITVDEEQCVLLFNAAAEKMFRCSTQEALGQSLVRFIPARFRAGHSSHIESFGQTGVTTRAMAGARAVSGLRSDGEEFPLEASVSQVEVGGQKLYTVIMRDITERERAEERFRQVIECAPNGMVMVDQTGKIALVNAEIEKSFGYSRDELLGQPIEILVPHSFRAHHPEYRNGFIKNPLARPMGAGRDLFGLRKDGTEFPVEIGLNPFETDQGMMVLGTVVDITERKQVEEKLQHVASIVEFSDDAIISKTLDGIITSWNRGAERLYGYKSEEIIGKSILTLMPTEHQDDLQQIIGRIKLGKSIDHSETTRVRKDGAPVYVSLKVSPMENVSGQIIGASVIAHDITGRRRVEEEVHRLNAELEQRVTERTAQLQAVNRELEAFSYSVSHDLRAPLRHINGFSQALLEDYADRLDEVGKGYLQEVRAASQEMAQLIDDVLNLARVTRSEMKWEEVDLSELAGVIMAELQKREPDRKVAVTIKAGLSAQGDKRLLRIMLGNLLGNAWKFTSRREHAEIAFGLEEKDGERCYIVRDNGAGFDMTYVDKLFGTFQRLHSTKEFEGTGIGLATVRRIVNRHGGHVRAEGALDQGATFYFTISDFRGL